MATKNLIRNVLVIAGLAGLISCAPVYAKRDYDKYPQHKKEIANYNIEKILHDICSCHQANVDYEKMSCGGNCQKCNSVPVGNSNKYQQICSWEYHDTFTIAWKDIKNISIENAGEGGPCFNLIPSGYKCLNFNYSAKCDIKARDDRQAQDLKEAIEIYLGER